MTSSSKKCLLCMFKIKLPTKCIFRIFPILRINGMAPFCNLFMERPSYFGKKWNHCRKYPSFVFARWQHRTDGLTAICNCMFCWWGSIAVETLGVINLRHLIPRRAGPTINGRFRRRTGNHVFFQRVSLAVQRYNSLAFKGTFTVPTELD